MIGVGSIFMDLCLCLSAFSPLFLIGAIRADNEVLQGWLIGLGVVFTLLLLIPIIGAMSRASRDFRITKVESASGEVAAYVATYILPLLIVGDKHPRDFIAYAACLALIALIFIRGNLLHYNPWVFLCGRRIFSVSVGNKQFYLIARGDPRSDQDVKVKVFGGRFMLM